MMGPQAVKGSACPARAAQILKVFDLTLPCALCGYMRFRRMSCCTSAGIISSAPPAEVSLTRGQAGHVNRKARPEEGP
jgi:hypothetical protein